MRIRCDVRDGYGLLLGSLFAWGCDSQSPEPSRSRVQGVLAASGAAAFGTPTHAAGEAVNPGNLPQGHLAAARSRVPLCSGQKTGSVFAPKRAPEQKLSGAEPLPTEPLQKGRYVWLNFWAAWCGPCKQELPMLLDWQRQLAGRMDVAFISLDDDERQLRTFLDAQPSAGLHRSYWLPEGNLRNEWLGALGLKGDPELPLQVLLDRSGKVRCKVNGSIEPGDLQTLRALLAE